jgi:hypothetical protein
MTESTDRRLSAACPSWKGPQRNRNRPEAEPFDSRAPEWGVACSALERPRKERRETRNPGGSDPSGRSSKHSVGWGGPGRRRAGRRAGRLGGYFLRCRIRLRIRRFLRPTLRRPFPRRRLAMRSPQKPGEGMGVRFRSALAKVSHDTRRLRPPQPLPSPSPRLFGRVAGFGPGSLSRSFETSSWTFKGFVNTQSIPQEAISSRSWSRSQPVIRAT